MAEKLLIKMAIATAILESSEISIVHLDQNGDIGYVSKGFSEILEASSQDVVGKNIKDFLAPDEDHIFNERFAGLGHDLESGDFDGKIDIALSPMGNKKFVLACEIQRLCWPNQVDPHFCIFVEKIKKI